MPRTPERTTLVLASLALSLVAMPAAADWLVTTDGVEIETRGPWRVEGRQVVFTGADGKLASLRLSECDLESSTAVTTARSRPARPSARPPERPGRSSGPVLVLTDADVDHVRPAPPRRAAPPTEAAAETSAEPVAAPAGEVVVSDWRPRDEEEGIAIRGQVRNDSRNVAGRVQVVAVFRDADGETIEKRPAALSASTLRPGQKADFLVQPFGLYSYGSIEFEVRHFTLLTGAPAGGSADERP